MADSDDRGSRRHTWALDAKQKVSVSIAGAGVILVALVGFHTFLAGHTSRIFVSEAEAGELAAEVQQQIKDISESAKRAADAAASAVFELRSHVAGEEIKAARNKMDELRGEISTTLLWESANGANDISRARKRDLEIQFERTAAYVQCLEAQRPNCQP